MSSLTGVLTDVPSSLTGQQTTVHTGHMLHASCTGHSSKTRQPRPFHSLLHPAHSLAESRHWIHEKVNGMHTLLHQL